MCRSAETLFASRLHTRYTHSFGKLERFFCRVYSVIICLRVIITPRTYTILYAETKPTHGDAAERTVEKLNRKIFSINIVIVLLLVFFSSMNGTKDQF